MLFPRAVLDRIAAGDITVAYRRWKRPTVKAGGRLRTAAGELAIDEVAVVAPSSVTDRDARRAGAATVAALLAVLDRHADLPLYRIRFRLLGADPRVALRRSTVGLDDALAALDRLDKASRRGAWTGAVLRLIGRRPGVRAADLAASLGRETLAFKGDVRKLKELGLTESLDTGYRLSPRGVAALKRR